MGKKYASLLNDYREIEKSGASKLLEKLKTASIKENIKIIVKDQIVATTNVCIILSCPGRLELLNDRPCSGRTGINLGSILIELHSKRPDLFRVDSSIPGEIIRDYTIINSSEIVHFEDLDNQTEADEQELNKPENITRLKKNANCSTLFLVCGTNARGVYEKHLKSSVTKTAYIAHLGDQGINNAYPNCYPYEGRTVGDLIETKDRSQARYKLITECICNQLE